MANSVIQFRRFGSPSKVLLALLALWLSPTLISSVHAQSKAPDGALQQKLEGLRRQALNAWMHNDVPTLKNIMATDFQLIGSFGVTSRDGWLAVLPQCSLSAYSIGQEQLKSLTPDSAMLILKVDYSSVCPGTPNPAKSIITDTFVRRDGKWWIVNTVFSSLPQ